MRKATTRRRHPLMEVCSPFFMWASYDSMLMTRRHNLKGDVTELLRQDTDIYGLPRRHLDLHIPARAQIQAEICDLEPEEKSWQ